jgi:ferredoxin
MAKIKFKHSQEEIEIEDNSPISEFCEEAGVPFACTEGVCGTCVIEVVEGGENLTEPSQEEVDFLGDDCSEERLACQCMVKSGSVTLTF